MAKKHFDEYVLKLAAQYEEFERTLKQVSKEAEEGLTDLDFVERLEEQIVPIRENYRRVMYIKFLLDQPTRKEKLKKYERQNKKLISQLGKENSPEGVLQENDNIIKNISTNQN